MTATAYADDFVNLAGWTPSNMVVSGGEVKASADNATIGKITRDYKSAADNNFLRAAFDLVVDKSMTAATQVSVSFLDSASQAGTGIYLKQNVGIVCASYFNTPGFGAATTLLGWASLVDGARYHVECTFNPITFYGFFSLYDPNGNLVARNTVAAGSIAWFNLTKIVIESNSTKTTVSRFAIDPLLVGSVTTGRYFTNVAKFTFALTDTTPVDLYIPGGGYITDLAACLHGAGQTLNFTEIEANNIFGPIAQTYLKLGAIVVAPSIPDGLGNTNSWGNDYGTASVIAAIAFVRNLIGNVRAPVHLSSYSMGTLTAGRLIGYEALTNVRSWCAYNGCFDIADLEQGVSFATAIDTAWGVSHQASYAAAQATFARGNPMGLLASNPGRFAGVAIYLAYATTGDSTVTQSTNSVAFDALLTTKNIAHKSALRVFATHTENAAVGDASAFLAQSLAASGGGSQQSGSMMLCL